MKVKGYITKIDIDHNLAEQQTFGSSAISYTAIGPPTAKVELIFTGDFNELIDAMKNGEEIEIDTPIVKPKQHPLAKSKWRLIRL
jgi:saccharopine dehydrogenase-like NADP-dependent oxidoreductase